MFLLAGKIQQETLNQRLSGLIVLCYKFYVMKAQLAQLLENSKNYTLAVANAMPGNLYEFKPAAETWTFGEQLNHIAYGIQWWSSNFIKGEKAEWAPPEAIPNRSPLTRYLEQCYDEWKQLMDTNPLTENSIRGFYATMDHITHHRGQLIIYLRMNGVTPPDYSY